ncbi:hypothetical protein [Streptomyces sp. TRM70350]|uniref:hypothetical protein n=1 Tax=Streptomyces sp. TRM70350 TaxID=2856165 RepID=UPI001C48968E|nr:hypothetical protein [Streptomyces sp. TRM70350]MBV7700489.1 hypothetical protein [Streptomyces sp. TRM70350]
MAGQGLVQEALFVGLKRLDVTGRVHRFRRACVTVPSTATSTGPSRVGRSRTTMTGPWL